MFVENILISYIIKVRNVGVDYEEVLAYNVIILFVYVIFMYEL